MHRAVVVGVSLWLAGCANNSAPIMEAGNGTYLILADAFPYDGVNNAAASAYQDAEIFCATKTGLHANPIRPKATDPAANSGRSVSIQFRCSP